MECPICNDFEDRYEALLERTSKLDHIVNLAARWYLAGDGRESLPALQDLESALHIYLETLGGR